MKVHQQLDGTFLAEQRTYYGRLQIAEAETQDGAWDSMIEMMGQFFEDQAQAMLEEAGYGCH